MGFDLSPYNLREVSEMVNAKGQYDWGIMLSLGEIIANSQPNFSRKRRPPVKLAHLNPFGKSPVRQSKGIPLKGELGKAALDSCSKIRDRGADG